MSACIFLENLWRDLCGLSEKEIPIMLSLDELKMTEWSSHFENLMRNRLIIGAFRYGRLHAEGKKTYDRIAEMHKRLDRYSQTGNLEMLVDIANIALCEFEEGTHPKRHLKAIDDGEHAK